MRVLIAEDDKVSSRLLQATLGRLGYDVVTTENGTEAWEALQAPDAPRLAILDWMMPGLDGVDVCRSVRQRDDVPYVYIILLTARAQKKDVVTDFEAGVDDYLVKPFDPQELRSRITVGERILKLEAALEGKVHELKDALSHVKQLQGLLPICMHCKKIRDDGDTWHRVESYIEEHSEAMFTHSLCEECMAKHYPDHGKKRSTEKAEQVGGAGRRSSFSDLFQGLFRRLSPSCPSRPACRPHRLEPHRPAPEPGQAFENLARPVPAQIDADVAVDQQQLAAVGEVGVESLDHRPAAVGELEQQRLLDLVELPRRDDRLLGAAILLGDESCCSWQNSGVRNSSRKVASQ